MFPVRVGFAVFAYAINFVDKNDRGAILRCSFEQLTHAFCTHTNEYLREVAAIAATNASIVSAAGHAGDGNIHLSVFQPDADVRHTVMHAIIAAAGRHGQQGNHTVRP